MLWKDFQMLFHYSGKKYIFYKRRKVISLLIQSDSMLSCMGNGMSEGVGVFDRRRRIESSRGGGKPHGIKLPTLFSISSVVPVEQLNSPYAICCR